MSCFLTSHRDNLLSGPETSVIRGQCGFPGVSGVKNLPAKLETQETQVLSLGLEDPLEEEIVTHSSILVWRIP